MKNLILLSLILIFSCTENDKFGFPIEQQEITERSTTIPHDITVKLANPSINGADYSVDVMMKSTTDSLIFFGGNIRFFIPYNTLVFQQFYGFAPGYGKFSPNPPRVNTGNLSSGPAMFGVSGPVTYVNGAVQITNVQAAKDNPTYLSQEYTKIFSILFKAKAPVMCVPVILEKNANPAYGGFLRGSDGLTLASVKDLSLSTTNPITEYVEHLNWKQFQGAVNIPFGATNSATCPNF